MTDATESSHPDSGDRLVVEADIDSSGGIGGVVWKLPSDGDLNGNLVRLAAGRRIDEHRNDDVDVLLVIRTGSGELDVDGVAHPLTETTVALVPCGTVRSITAGRHGISYLSIHRRRAPLSIRTSKQ